MSIETIRETTPENIIFLKEGEFFVFGSNLGGRHGSGAARTAKEKFGAKYGIGEGITGQCYAFPTLDEGLNRLSHDELMKSVIMFIREALANPGATFYLTKVGCGLAGYDEEYMKSFFVQVPSNVIKPEGW